QRRRRDADVRGDRVDLVAVPEGDPAAVGGEGRVAGAAGRRYFGRVGAGAVGVDHVERLVAGAGDAADEGDLGAVRRPSDVVGRHDAIGEVSDLDGDVGLVPGRFRFHREDVLFGFPQVLADEGEPFAVWRPGRIELKDRGPVVGEVDVRARVVGVEQADV